MQLTWLEFKSCGYSEPWLCCPLFLWGAMSREDLGSKGPDFLQGQETLSYVPNRKPACRGRSSGTSKKKRGHREAGGAFQLTVCSAPCGGGKNCLSNCYSLWNPGRQAPLVSGAQAVMACPLHSSRVGETARSRHPERGSRRSTKMAAAAASSV